MKTEYINREEAMTIPILPEDQRIRLDRINEAFEEGWRQALECLAFLPSADVVEVRHGQFIGTEYDGYADGNPVYYEWICSECGCVFEDDEPKMNFCPNCGAKMDGGQDDD